MLTGGRTGKLPERRPVRRILSARLPLIVRCGVGEDTRIIEPKTFPATADADPLTAIGISGRHTRLAGIKASLAPLAIEIFDRQLYARRVYVPLGATDRAHDAPFDFGVVCKRSIHVLNSTKEGEARASSRPISGDRPCVSE